MPNDQLEKVKAPGFERKPRTVVIKHGLFWYYDTDTRPVNGELKEVVVERLAFNGDEVEVPFPVDQERGDLYGAFYSDEELQKIKHPSVTGETQELESGQSGQPDPDDLDDGELVDWIMSTGEFDGQKKPNVDQVVAAAGGDPDKAARLLEAEEKAQGGQPRSGVQEGLERVIESE